MLTEWTDHVTIRRHNQEASLRGRRHGQGWKSRGPSYTQIIYAPLSRGQPLVDIDIQSEISPEDEALTKTAEELEKEKERVEPQKEPETRAERKQTEKTPDRSVGESTSRSSGKHASLATPAVRHLTKEHGIEITDISGTGKGGRVLKEDVQKHASARTATASASPPSSSALGEDKIVAFTPVQRKMYETMTRSLSIPHFLYSDMVDFTTLTKVRRAINTHSSSTKREEQPPKLSALPFIIKAVSLALDAHPSLNAHLDTATDPNKPKFTQKASHNIGFAVDTPQGLLVPVIKNVQSHSITSLATEINRLSTLARINKLASSDFSGATFTVSNIGSIGGLTVAPVIVSPQVAILGVGKARAVPAFAEDGSVVRREECVFSWSADHRVVDGATVARCGEMVREYLEGTERMLVKLS
jgi:2-oxoisovalerate dehydrogenase E2 component (dihydrolipoyl transacylase)